MVEDQTSIPKGALENANDMEIKEELEQLDNIKKHQSSPKYLDFSGEGSLKHTVVALADVEDKDEDEESSGEEGGLLDETDNIVYNQEIEKHIEGMVNIANDNQKPTMKKLKILNLTKKQFLVICT